MKEDQRTDRFAIDEKLDAKIINFDKFLKKKIKKRIPAASRPIFSIKELNSCKK